MAKLNFKKATPIKSSPPKEETPKASKPPENIPPPEEDKKLEVDTKAEPEKKPEIEETAAEEFEMEEIESEPHKAAGKPKEFKFREDVFDNGEAGVALLQPCWFRKCGMDAARESSSGGRGSGRPTATSGQGRNHRALSGLPARRHHL